MAYLDLTSLAPSGSTLKFTKVFLLSERDDNTQTDLRIRSAFDYGFITSGSVCQNIRDPDYVGYQEVDMACFGRYIAIQSISSSTIYLSKVIVFGEVSTPCSGSGSSF